ncbi:PHB depolymerase family esterase [Conexibacter sp. SYSU D00693]|uniref:extracellular catalytic domain type 1 short-chain-length polyhydroxyalkanoate depolymerase n=1 Tax=Conexibacter sp. SYSU D00693 TaxID=2812560 RepID=UPI00196B898B|nr:PHB depolymerase family esterase [Conexibacter sp. SYSU D00693]
MRVRTCSWIVGVALALVPAAAHAAESPGPGTLTSGSVTSDGARYDYLRYVPSTYRPGTKAPLLVSVHGCQTTADAEMRSTLWNRVAEREGFVVLYPDVDVVGRLLPGPLNQCWKFFSPTTYARGGGDPDAIAQMTRRVVGELDIDRERVYAVGTSAGGLMTSVLASTYAEMFAAVGLVETAGFLDGPCFTTGIGIPVQLSAQLARAGMGGRARVVPVIGIGGTADLAFPPTCIAKAVEQGLRTSNLVLGASQTGPISLRPATVSHERKPGGRSYTVSRFQDPAGCLVAERWIIDGLAHSWPGGTTDRKYNTDPKAPDGSEAIWPFLRRYTRSTTAMPCAEAPVEPASSPVDVGPAACPPRTVTVTLPRGARVRGVRASVGRTAVRVRRAGRRVRVTLPAGRPGDRTRVVLTVRRAGRAKAQTVRRSFKRC